MNDVVDAVDERPRRPACAHDVARRVVRISGKRVVAKNVEAPR